MPQIPYIDRECEKSMTNTPKAKPLQPSRLISLDLFRGITIALMIVINQASVAPEVYPWLAHADWHGCTLADLVFPWFLWIMGMAMAFSLEKYQGNLAGLNTPIHRKILRRTLMLFLLGLVLNGYWSYDFPLYVSGGCCNALVFVTA